MASSSPRRTERRSARALDQVVARRREDAALRQAADGVAGTADPLQERRDAVWRADLAYEIDVPDVDPELERGRGHERAQLTGLQPALGVEPRLLRQAAVMRGDGVLSKPLAQVPRQPFRHAPRIDEYQRRPVRRDERRQPVVILVPDLVRHHRFERGAGDFDPEIHVAAMPGIDDRAGLRGGADEIARDLVDRLLRCRQADAQQRLLRNTPQAFERQREVRAPPRPDDGMDLVDDHRAHRSQHVAAAFRREQQVERLRRGDEDVRWRAQHRGPFRCRCVTGANRRRNPRCGQPGRGAQLSDSSARLREILVDVGAQRLERRDVEHPDFVRQPAIQGLACQLIERCEKRRQRLARSSGRRNQRVPTVENRCPAVLLRRGRLAEC